MADKYIITCSIPWADTPSSIPRCYRNDGGVLESVPYEAGDGGGGDTGGGGGSNPELDDLTLDDVGALSTAALTLWAIAWGIKHLARLIFNSKAGRF